MAHAERLGEVMGSIKAQLAFHADTIGFFTISGTQAREAIERTSAKARGSASGVAVKEGAPARAAPAARPKPTGIAPAKDDKDSDFEEF